MERLLKAFLRQFIRRGTLRLTTAGGTTFTVGDGGAPAAAVRFTSKAAELRVMLDPEVKLGEAYMDGTFVVEEGSIGDVLAILLGQNNTGLPPTWARVQWLIACSSSTGRRGRNATSPIIMISTVGYTRSFSMPTGNTAAPISKRRSSRWMMRSLPRNGILPPSF